MSYSPLTFITDTHTTWPQE